MCLERREEIRVVERFQTRHGGGARAKRLCGRGDQGVQVAVEGHQESSGTRGEMSPEVRGSFVD